MTQVQDRPANLALTPRGGALHCVTFLLGGELFGVEIRWVQEIIELGTIRSVPMMPPFVRGIINLRGTVVPVIDLSVRLGRGLSPLAASSCVAIFALGGEAGEVLLGVLFDSVCEVLEIAAEKIEAPPSFGAKIRGDFVLGIATIEGRFAVLLDAERAFSVEELALLAESMSSAQPTA